MEREADRTTPAIRRPLVVAFDVIETLFSLDPLRRQLAAAGPGAPLLESFFTRL